MASPRFQGGNLDPNWPWPSACARRIARERGAAGDRPGGGAGADIVPLVGARRRDSLQEALGAAGLVVGPAELSRLEAIVPRDAAAGQRYNAAQMARMAHLDSEMG
jgi:pyridoxine 4-dehydrogenase